MRTTASHHRRTKLYAPIHPPRLGQKPRPPHQALRTGPPPQARLRYSASQHTRTKRSVPIHPRRRGRETTPPHKTLRTRPSLQD